ncbi:MAG: TRAM domain-containing protein, partial [Bacillota bacterium]|nr:TRAM domain-containing protein [Bacillota bacterium]
SVEVLVEGTSLKQAQVFSGRTGQNQLVNFTIEESGLLPAGIKDENGNIDGDQLEGSIATVRITEAKTFSLVGVLEAWRA